MESPDIRKLRKQIREMRSSQKVGASVAKMSAEELQHEISYHETAAKSAANKAKRNKVVEAAPAPAKKVVRRKAAPAPEVKSQTRLSPKKKASRGLKVLDDSDDVIQVDENFDGVEPKVTPRVKKAAARIVREIPEVKKNVKNSAAAVATPIRCLAKTAPSLRRPYIVESDDDSPE